MTIGYPVTITTVADIKEANLVLCFGAKSILQDEKLFKKSNQNFHQLILPLQYCWRNLPGLGDGQFIDCNRSVVLTYKNSQRLS
jgi:hypothetical protein